MIVQPRQRQVERLLQVIRLANVLVGTPIDVSLLGDRMPRHLVLAALESDVSRVGSQIAPRLPLLETSYEASSGPDNRHQCSPPKCPGVSDPSGDGRGRGIVKAHDGSSDFALQK